VEERLGTLAWSIVSDVHSRLETEVSDEPQLLTEATRLASLNLILKKRFPHGELDINDDEILLSSFSFEGNRSGISKSVVLKLITQIIDSTTFIPEKKIQKRMEKCINRFI